MLLCIIEKKLKQKNLFYYTSTLSFSLACSSFFFFLHAFFSFFFFIFFSSSSLENYFSANDSLLSLVFGFDMLGNGFCKLEFCEFFELFFQIYVLVCSDWEEK